MVADWALSNKHVLKDKKIIELGSGIGFTGVTVAKFCNPVSIMLTDCHHDVLRTLCDNIEINFQNVEKETMNDVILYNNKITSIGKKTKCIDSLLS